MTLTFGSLFSGIGGIDLGLERAGMQCKWQVEIDDYCQRVLQKHWADVPKFRDVRGCGRHNLEPVDLVCGGFPCQDVSLAGQRAGLDGKRSTLWSEFHRIICEIEPRWVLAENVPGLLSSDDGQFMGNILRDLAESGYDAEWGCIPAAAVGAPHRRDRIFIVAHTDCVGLQGDRPSGFIFAQAQAGTWLSGCRSAGSGAGQWATEPNVGRVANGIPARVDRLRALGNAVVPQVAEYIGRLIVEAAS